MKIYSFLYVFLLFGRARSEKSDAIDPTLLEDKYINEKLDDNLYFDLGKKFESNYYEKPVTEMHITKHKLLSVQLENYIMKYIRVFLFHLDLQNKGDLLKDHEETKINLEFVINGRDLKFIKDMSKNLKAGQALDKLYRLDAILGSGFKQTFLNEEATNYFAKFNLNKYLLSKDFHFAIVCCLLIISIICRHYMHFQVFIILFILLNFLIISEGYIKYLNKIKDVEFEDYYKYYSTNEDDCDPGKQTFLSRLWNNKYNPFSSDKCFNKLKSAYSKSSDTVFPLAVILEVYIYYFLEVPASGFGKCIRYFSESLNDHLYFGFKEIGMGLTYCLVSVILLCLCVLFMKPRLRLGFLGLNIGIDLARGTNEITDNQHRRQLEGEELVTTNRIQILPGNHSRESREEKKEERIALADWNNDVSNTDQVSESPRKKNIVKRPEKE